MSLETEVQALTVATTDLLEAVNIGKQNLDAAENAAELAATQALASQNAAATSASTATTAAATATTQAGIAAAQANNAVAVVTGGTASLTAAAGRIPIADANAELDASWMTGIANNAYPTTRPTLDLDFINGATIDPRITFTRASSTTYYDGKTFAKAEENLLTFSQDFDNAAWTKILVTVTANATAAPNGSFTADLITENTATNVHQLRAGPVSYKLGETNVISVYAKAASGSRFLNLYPPFSVGGNSFGSYDLTNGTSTQTVGTGSGVSAIQSVGSGWYRCVFTFVAQSSQVSPVGLYFGLSDAINQQEDSYTGDGTSGIFLWGAQLEARSQVTAYTPTTTQPITRFQPQLMTAPANTAVIDHDPVTGARLGLRVWEARTNLFSRSQEFDNAAWSKGGVTLAANANVAPDGTLTADAVAVTANSGIHVVFPGGQSGSPNTTYTISVFAKANGYSFIALALNNNATTAGNEAMQVFNLETGTVASAFNTAPISASITNAGSGWYRCTMTWAIAGGVCSPAIFMCNANQNPRTLFAGDGTSGALIWGAQLEARSQVTAYTATTTQPITRYQPQLMTAPANTAVIDHDPVTGARLGLRVWEARTNLLTRSEEFDNAAWFKTGFNGTNGTGVQPVITANAGLSLNGSLTARRVNLNLNGGTSSNDRSGFFQEFSVTVGSVQTGTVFVKPLDGTTEAQLLASWIGLVANSGTPTRTITHIGNGVYRIVTTSTSASPICSFRVQIIGSGGMNSFDGLILGAQLEAGSSASPYIPTTTAQVTRAADNLSMQGANFSSWYRQDEGTLFAEFRTNTSTTAAFTECYATLTGPAIADRIEISKAGGQTGLGYAVLTNNVMQANPSWLIPQHPSIMRTAVVFANNDFVASTNGGTVQTDTSGTVPAVDRLNIGQRGIVGNQANGHIRHITYYPARLPNATLQAMTKP